MTWHEARWAAFAAASALAIDTVPLATAVGRTLASDVLSLIDVPHYASAAMDGWAVAGTPPWRVLDPGSEAHPTSQAALDRGTAVLIVTGGLVPEGATGVLQSEFAHVDGGVLTVAAVPGAREPSALKHVRPAGEESRAGEVVVRAGATLTPPRVAVIAASGHDEVPVVREPRVALVLTGDEVVEAGIPAPGRVRDSFGVQLPAVVGMLGATLDGAVRVLDDRDAVVAAIGAAARADVVVTTGGTGTSAADHIRGALLELGATIVVERVAMRPGSPSLLATLPDGRLVVGLPGNPLAAMMGVLTLLEPVIASLLGRATPPLGAVELAADVAATPAASRPTRLVPYVLSREESAARSGAVATPWTGSAMLRGLAEAAGVLVIPPDGAARGETVEVLRLPWTA
ncbi:molybdopterin molybdotransferase MoeA [Marisediminicola sp. LYQ85]